MKTVNKIVNYIDEREELKIFLEIIEEFVKIALIGAVMLAFGMVLAMLGGV